MMGLFYQTDDDVKNDVELQAWMTELQADDGAAIKKGLPVTNGRMETRDQLFKFLTTILFTVTSRHSSIENGALNYSYVPANPFLYRLKAPKTADKVYSPRKVSKKLPPINQAIKGYALIASADFDPADFGRLGLYEDDFTNGWPAGVQTIIDAWNAALTGVDDAIVDRNEDLETPYTAVLPSKTFNSISTK